MSKLTTSVQDYPCTCRSPCSASRIPITGQKISTESARAAVPRALCLVQWGFLRDGGALLQYVIAGLELGGIYAVTAAGLTVTYLAAGILNFAFGALAFFLARLFYFLNTQHGWSVPAAATASIVIAGPLLGILLYTVLFRHLQLSTP